MGTKTILSDDDQLDYWRITNGDPRAFARAIEQAVMQSEQVKALMQQWQPVETAPKDCRTLLLGYFNSHGNWRTVRGQWMGDDYIRENCEDPDGVESGWFETPSEADDLPNSWRINPSHWMPLPPPPTESAMEQQ